MKKTGTLKSSYEFEHVMKKGKWFAGDLMSIYVISNNSKCNMLGIAVGKKFSKSSVKRNRVRRLIKEAYRLNEDIISKGYLIVIVWKNNNVFEEITFDKVYKDLSKCLKKADL